MKTLDPDFKNKSCNNSEKGLEKLREFIPLIGVLISFSGFCIVVYQLYLYLKNGEWLSLSTLDAIKYIASESKLYDWLINPEDWIGLSNLFFKILNYMPLTVVIVILGLFIIAIYDDAESNNKKEV